MLTIFNKNQGSRHGGSRVLGYSAVPLTSLLFNPLQWWRLVTGPYVFASLGELFFGLILLYVFRLFERLWGSQKYFVIFYNIHNMLDICYFYLFGFISCANGACYLVFTNQSGMEWSVCNIIVIVTRNTTGMR